MNNLLHGNEKRQLQLAETLIQNGDWLKLKELADKLNYSERTIKYDLKNFKETFTDFTIETSHRGIRLIFDHNKGLKNIYGHILESSNAFKLLEIIFLDETCNVTDLADKLYISPSTLYRIIHQVNQVTEEDDFYIETNPCKVTGDEDKIRYFYYRLFFEKYTIMTWPYYQMNAHMIDDLLYFLMDLTDFKADFAYYSIARLILFVNLKRYEKENYVTMEKTDLNFSKIVSKMNQSPENIKYFEKQFKLKINQAFITQLLFPFVQDGYSFNDDHLKSKIAEDKKVFNQVEVINDLLNELSEGHKIPLPNKDKVVFEVYNAIHIEKYDPRSGCILYDRNQLFAQTIHTEFPNFFQQLYEGIKNIRRIMHLPSTEKDINYLIYIIFTEWEGLIIELEHQRQKVSVLIISNRNLAHSYMLSNCLSLKFNSYLTIDVYDDTIVTQSILENLTHDIIIANFPIPELRHKESIYIENFPNPNELSQIQKKIDKILAQK